MCLPNFHAGPGGLGRDDRGVSLDRTRCARPERGLGHWISEPDYELDYRERPSYDLHISKAQRHQEQEHIYPNLVSLTSALTMGNLPDVMTYRYPLDQLRSSGQMWPLCLLRSFSVID